MTASIDAAHPKTICLNHLAQAVAVHPKARAAYDRLVDVINDPQRTDGSLYQADLELTGMLVRSGVGQVETGMILPLVKETLHRYRAEHGPITERNHPDGLPAPSGLQFLHEGRVMDGPARAKG